MGVVRIEYLDLLFTHVFGWCLMFGMLIMYDSSTWQYVNDVRNFSMLICHLYASYSCYFHENCVIDIRIGIIAEKA